jgi:hypothetical protein
MAGTLHAVLRRGGALVAIAALVLACREDPLPGLRAEKAAFLESTVPKAGFWEAVERKGALVKEARGAEAELARLAPRSLALERRLEEVRAALSELEDASGRSERVLAENRAERERLQAELHALAETLVGFEARRRAGAAG